MFNFKKNKRPATVPQEAVWNEGEGEWELGKKNEDGDEVGEWKWWLAPNGHLCCHTFFDDNGNMIKAKRFHPNGEVSLDLYYNEDGDEVRNYYRSTEDTEEYYPDSVYENDWRAELKVGSAPRSHNYYDKQGNLLNLLNDSFNIEDLKKGPEHETAEQAIARLNKAFDRLVDYINQNEELEDDFAEELEYDHRPICDDRVTLEQIEKTESRIGISYPPSFKDFILKHGLTKFGNTYNVDKALMPPQICDKIACEFVDSGIDLEKSYSKETIERLDKIIPFQNLEFQEGEGYFCFDYSTLNPETGEVSVVEYHADEMMAVIVDPVEMCQGKGFDKHMSQFVDKEIEEILWELED